MTRFPCLLAMALTLAACSENPDRTYTGGSGGTHDCGKEKSVAVDGSGGTFVFTGSCDSITVNGGDTKLTVEAVKAITINGAKNNAVIGAVDRVAVRGYGNIVTWRKGLSGASPHTVTATGDNNSIEQAK